MSTPAPDRAPSLTKIALVVGLLAVLFCVARLARHEWNPTVFTLAGARFTEPSELPAGTRTFASGYDGTFYYRMALSPFDTSDYSHGIRFDEPVYRHQRILYPLLVHVLSLGIDSVVPWMMIAVNIAALVAIALLGATLAQQAGASSSWGYVFALWPGFAMSLSLNLTEVVSAALLLASLVALRAGRDGPAALAMMGAVLARESALILPVATLVVALVQRSRRRTLAFGAVLAGWILWQVVLATLWNTSPLTGNGDRVTAPFTGIASVMGFWLERLNPIAVWEILIICLILATLFILLRANLRARAPLHERAAFLLAAAAGTTYFVDIWGNHFASLRAVTEPVLLGAPGLISLYPRHAAAAGKAVGLLCLAVLAERIAYL